LQIALGCVHRFHMCVGLPFGDEAVGGGGRSSDGGDAAAGFRPEPRSGWYPDGWGHAHVQTTLDISGLVRQDEALRAAANWKTYTSTWQLHDER